MVPKFALLAGPQNGGSITARYFMPWKCHPSYAVTGSICTGSCLLAPGTVAASLADLEDVNPTPVRIEHPSGAIDVIFDCAISNDNFTLPSAGLLRTARKLFKGQVSVPTSVLG